MNTPKTGSIYIRFRKGKIYKVVKLGKEAVLHYNFNDVIIGIEIFRSVKVEFTSKG